MADACELIMLNLGFLPSSRVAVSAGDKKKSKGNIDSKRKRPFTLDYLIDAIMTNGESLRSNENRWYGRDGGDSWVMDISALVSEDETEDDDGDELMTVKTANKSKAPVPVTFKLDTKIVNTALAATQGKSGDNVKMYKEQCQVAAADAMERILNRSKSARDPSIADFGNQIAAKLAWSLQKLKPLNDLKSSSDMASEAIASTSTKIEPEQRKNTWTETLSCFTNDYPLVSSCIQYEISTVSHNSDNFENDRAHEKPAVSLTQRLLNEAFLASFDHDQADTSNLEKFENTLHLYIASVLHTCERSDDKPLDIQRKKVASAVSSSLAKELSIIPFLTEQSLELVSLLCDIDGITKKALEISRKTTNQNVATAAATNGKY
jgi:symplekin